MLTMQRLTQALSLYSTSEAAPVFEYISSAERDLADARARARLASNSKKRTPFKTSLASSQSSCSSSSQ